MTRTEESCSILVPSICPKTTEPIQLTIPNFLPELPHAAIVYFPIWFGLWTALSTFVNNYRIKFAFVRNNKISPTNKLERIKLEHETWSKVLLGFLAAYGVIEIAIFTILEKYCSSLTPVASEVSIYQLAFGFAVIINGIIFLICFVWEMLSKMKEIRELLTMDYL